MSYHVVLSRYLDVAEIDRQAREGLRPRHAMKQLADRLGAMIHCPDDERPTALDRVKSHLYGTPTLWAFGRRLADQLSSDDVVFCLDEQVGLPLLHACRARANGTKVVVMVHNLDRPRGRAALRLWPSMKSAEAYFAVAKPQVEFLRRVGIADGRALFIPDQTDLEFFKPGPASRKKPRPLLFSAGLEKRDYALLAKVAGELDVEVVASGFSADAHGNDSRVPQKWPSNFHVGRYEWREFADLYRSADAVVVCLVPNSYAAGIQSLIEGMASGRPVIISSTRGLTGYQDDEDAMIRVPAGDAAALKKAIERVLADPRASEAMGRRGNEIAAERYSSEGFVETIAALTEELAAASR